MKYRVSMVLFIFLCLPIGTAQASETESAPQGKELFNFYGCTNCHGPEGIHPTSRHVPVLKGQSADYLLENALLIFAGEKLSGKTRLMHEQFCIGEVNEEGCYPTPKREHLQIISTWLAQESLPEKKRTPQELYSTAVEAVKTLTSDDNKALLIDIRSREEVTFLGMPTIADANIPFVSPGNYTLWDEKKQTYQLVPNSAFTQKVHALLTAKGHRKDDPIYLLCRSGNRSAKAAKLLNALGYNTVINITDGFEGDTLKSGPLKGQRALNGWKNAGLPWSYKLNKEKLY